MDARTTRNIKVWHQKFPLSWTFLPFSSCRISAKSLLSLNPLRHEQRCIQVDFFPQDSHIKLINSLGFWWGFTLRQFTPPFKPPAVITVFFFFSDKPLPFGNSSERPVSQTRVRDEVKNGARVQRSVVLHLQKEWGSRPPTPPWQEPAELKGAWPLSWLRLLFTWLSCSVKCVYRTVPETFPDVANELMK